MSRGNPVVQVRVARWLLAAIDQAVADSVAYRDDEPHTRSSFVRDAIVEVFRHRARAQRARQARRERRSTQPPAEPTS